MTQDIENNKINDEGLLFDLGEPQDVYETPIFKVYSRKVSSEDTDNTLDAHFIRCADWVNVIPVLPNGDVVLIKQHRWGTDSICLETPGGAVDAGESDTTLAAVRELQEETGLTSNTLLPLPYYNPNPAIQGNKIQYFVALNCMLHEAAEPHLDEFEKTSVQVLKPGDAVQAALDGRMRHALCALALLAARRYLLKD